MRDASYVIVLASSTPLARVHVLQTWSLLPRRAEASWVLITTVFSKHLLETRRIFQVFIRVFQLLHKGLFVVYFVGDITNYWSLGGVTRGHAWRLINSCLILSRPVERKLICTLLWYEQYALMMAKTGCHAPQISCWKRYKRCCKTSARRAWKKEGRKNGFGRIYY